MSNSKKMRPCGGCGAETPKERCMGCMHDFGYDTSVWVREYSPSPKRASALSDLALNDADIIATCDDRESGPMVDVNLSDL